MFTEGAVKGALDGFTNAARQMNVCRVDHDLVRILVDTHYAVERMLGLFGLLLMTRQVDDFLYLAWPEIAAQSNDAGRKFVIDAPAGRAKCLLMVFGFRPPVPAAVMKNSAALGAHRVVIKLLLPLIRIEDVILLRVSGNSAVSFAPVGPQACLFHFEAPFRN
jgi:hypothetical protein